MASINVILFTSKTLKNGEHPIMIRIIQDRRTKYFSLGHSCSLDMWDKTKNLPKRKHPEFKELSILIEHKKSEANRKLMKFETEESNYSADQLKDVLFKKNTTQSIFDYLDTIISNHIKIGKIGNSKVYRDLKRVLKIYTNNKDLNFNSINVPYLKKLEQNFKEQRFNPNTMSLYMRTLRSTINRAIQDDLLDKEKNPFKSYSISHLKNETIKRAISRTDIKKIEAITTEPKSKIQFAQDYFMFSYYSRGINFKDFALLKMENIVELEDSFVLSYFRLKTKKRFTIKLLPEAIEIFNRYKVGLANQDYIFPVLDRKVHVKPITIENRIKKVATQVNKHLKTLAEQAGIEPGITTYTARHTFATVLKKSGVATGVISEMMGHKSEAITQVYLDSFDDEKLYDASLNL